MKSSYKVLKPAFFLAVALFIAACLHYLLFTDSLLVSDDYRHHAARTANYYLALKQGQLLPRWAPNLNGGFGYPAFNYTYQLPYFIAALIHTFGLSIQVSVNMAVVGFGLFGVFATFLLAKVHKLSSFTSMLLAIAFVANPYYLLSIYWRGAFGEVAFVAFVPLLLAGIELLLASSTSKWKKLIGWLFVFASTAATILSHLPSVIILVPLVLGILLIKRPRRAELVRPVTAAITGLFVTAWYWIPAIFERSFIVYDQGSSLQKFTEHLIAIPMVFEIWRTSLSSEFFTETLQVGLLPIIVCLLAIAYIYKTKDKLVTYWLFVILATLLLMDHHFEWLWNLVKPLQFIQFPWRLLWLVNLASIVLSIYLIRNKPKYRQAIRAVLVVSMLMAVFGYVHPKGYETRSDYEWYESVATGSSYDEHRPIWVQKLPDFSSELVFLPTSTVSASTSVSQWQTADDSAVTSLVSSGTRTTYEISLINPTTVVHHKLYFPGWQVFVAGEQIEITVDNAPFPGLLSYQLPAGDHKVVVEFSKLTTWRKIGLCLTYLGIAFGVGNLYLLYFSTQTSRRAK